MAKKISAGANFIQTQCTYNMDRFRTFMKQAVDMGLTEKCHILAGVTPKIHALKGMVGRLFSVKKSLSKIRLDGSVDQYDMVKISGALQKRPQLNLVVQVAIQPGNRRSGNSSKSM